MIESGIVSENIFGFGFEFTLGYLRNDPFSLKIWIHKCKNTDEFQIKLLINTIISQLDFFICFILFFQIEQIEMHLIYKPFMVANEIFKLPRKSVPKFFTGFLESVKF